MKNTANKIYQASFILALFLSACQSSELSPEKFKEYASDPENGFVQVATLGTTKVELAYRPSALLALQELEGTDSIAQAAWDAAFMRYNAYLYFNLSLSDNGKEILYSPRNYANYSELLKTLSFRVGEFVSAKANDKEIALMDFYFQPTFGMGSSNTILLVFDKKELGEAEELEINIKDFGVGTGDQSFIYNTSELENIPTIKLN